jgi:hypothetical protein
MTAPTPLSAPTLQMIKSRNAFLNDAVIDACKRALRSKSKDLWMAWFRLAGEKVGLEEYLGLFVSAQNRGYEIGPGSGCWAGPCGQIYDSDWQTAVSVVGQAALTECSDMRADEIPHMLQEGRDHSAGWAQGVRSLLG